MKASSIILILGYYLASFQIISTSSTSVKKFSTSKINLSKKSSNVVPGSYIVEFNSESNVQSDINSFKNEGINYKVRETFNQKVFNAVSIKLDNDNDISKIKNLKCVKNVWPVVKIQKTKVKVEDSNDLSSQDLRSKIGFIEDSEQPKRDGSGVKVGIIDTGIDYKHPALGGCFKKDNCKVQFGFDFVGDDFNGTNDPKPDDDPLDECTGIGTHVAGIIAGKDANFTGIAPNVTLGAYRIFGCFGDTTNDLVIKAMEKAFEDGMNIVNLPLLSNDNAWFGSPESLVAESLTKNGLIVVAPAGNSGDKGFFKVTSPSTAPNVISVASADTEQINSFFITPSSDSKRKIQYLTIDETPVKLNENSLSIIPTSNVTNSNDDACNAINQSLNGTIALVRRGGCDDSTKINTVRNAGALAVILYNNNSNGIELPQFNSEGISSTPVASISCEDGVFLFNEFQKDNNNFTVQFTNENVLINNPNKLKISSLSSFGPTYELDIKPDISAPGNNITSTFPKSLGSFKSISGTSVSTSFITGAIALYMQDNKEKLTPEMILNIIQNNAKPMIIKNSNDKKNDSTIATTILQQGSGLIDLSNMLSSTIISSPTKLSLNDTNHFTGKKKTVTLKNIGKLTTKFTFNHLPAQLINGYDGINLMPTDSLITKDSFAKVKFSTNSILLRPNESKDINLSFTPPNENDLNHSIYSGYIVITNSLTKKNSYISYMGMKGCLNTLPIFDDQSGAPFIQSGLNDKKFTSQDEILTVSMKNNDIVLLGARMAYGTKIFTVDVIPAESNDTEPANPTNPTETTTTEIPTEPTEATTTKPTETKTKTRSKQTKNPTETGNPTKPTENPENPTKTTKQSTETTTATTAETTATESTTTTGTTTTQSIVIVTATTTVTPSIIPTNVVKRSYTSYTGIYKRKNNIIKSRAFDNSTTELLVPNSLGTISNDGISEFEPRNDNSESNQILTLQFNGKVNKLDGTKNVELPDGKYRLVLAALRPFGNPKKKNDWETFTSSIIEIKKN